MYISFFGDDKFKNVTSTFRSQFCRFSKNFACENLGEFGP